MRPETQNTPEHRPNNPLPSPFRGSERLLTPSQLSQLRFNLVWSYASTIALSSLTLRAIDVFTHSLMEANYGFATVNLLAILSLGAVTAVLGRMAKEATCWYASDITKRIRK